MCRPSDAPDVALAGFAANAAIKERQHEIAYRAASRVLDDARAHLLARGGTWRRVGARTAYVVAGVALRETDLEPLVLYVELGDPDAQVWCRPLASFLDGRFVRA